MKKVILISIAALFLLSCQKQNNQNSKLLLISIDGYRFDYTKNFGPPFLMSFANEGAQLTSLRPSFPTKTFPNHLSIITGMLPMNHGIIANHFFAPDLGKTYSLKNREAVSDGHFYLGMPFWNVLERKGIKTATYFWPGSEADIFGTRPSIYKNYDQNISNQERIKTVLEWAGMNDQNAPRFMTLYFSDVDSAGHKYGPNSKEAKEAVLKVDNDLKNLIDNLPKDLNIIIVSDHGMEEFDATKVEYLFASDEKAEFEFKSNYYIYGKGPIVHFYKKENMLTDAEADSDKLNKYLIHSKCYTSGNTPKELKFHTINRIGDIVCIAKSPWNIQTAKDETFPMGNHGWSQFETKNMDGIFYAKGPAFKEHFIMETVDNIHLFTLFANILGIKFDHSIDGQFQYIKGVLK